jgi:hypothetical protein
MWGRRFRLPILQPSECRADADKSFLRRCRRTYSIHPLGFVPGDNTLLHLGRRLDGFHRLDFGPGAEASETDSSVCAKSGFHIRGSGPATKLSVTQDIGLLGQFGLERGRR